MPAARAVMLVPLATRTWIDEAPGTMVASEVVVEPALGAVVGGVDGGGVDADAVFTSSGARVAEGSSSTPMMTATITTPTPRR